MFVWTAGEILLQSTMNGCNERYYEVRDLSIKNGLTDDQICHIPSVGATTACVVRKVPGERKTIKNEEGETTGESGITSALSYYLTNKSTIMKKFLQISRAILSLSIITLISIAICAVVSLLVLYVFGINDDTIRWCASIMLFGTILVALLLGAFD